MLFLSFLCLEAVWDYTFKKLGIVNPADHKVHKSSAWFCHVLSFLEIQAYSSRIFLHCKSLLRFYKLKPL